MITPMIFYRKLFQSKVTATENIISSVRPLKIIWNTTVPKEHVVEEILGNCLTRGVYGSSVDMAA